MEPNQVLFSAAVPPALLLLVSTMRRACGVVTLVGAIIPAAELLSGFSIYQKFNRTLLSTIQLFKL